MLAEILANILQAIADLIPRVARRPREDEFGIADNCFGERQFKWPRLTIPIFEQVEYWPGRLVPICLEGQHLTTADDYMVSVNCTVIIEIDPLVVREQFSFDDWEAGIAARLREEISYTVRGHNWSHLRSMDDLINEVHVESMGREGVWVRAVAVENMIQVFPITMVE